MQIPHCIDYCNFVVSFVLAGSCQSLNFALLMSIILGTLYFHMKLGLNFERGVADGQPDRISNFLDEMLLETEASEGKAKRNLYLKSKYEMGSRKRANNHKHQEREK